MRKIWSNKAHSLQGKYLSLVLTVILLPSLVVMSGLYILLLALIGDEMALPEGMHATFTPVLEQIFWILMVGYPIILVAVVVFAMSRVQRLTGPLRRMDRELDLMIRRNRIAGIKLRAQDELKPLVEKWNTLIQKAYS